MTCLCWNVSQPVGIYSNLYSLFTVKPLIFKSRVILHGVSELLDLWSFTLEIITQFHLFIYFSQWELAHQITNS